jgi:ribonuclease HI
MLTAEGLLSSKPLEVKIFTDCQGSLIKIRNLYSRCPPEQQLRQDMAMSKFITTSQRLSQLGVRVGFHWVPGHAGVPGNEKADQVARRAAKRSA